jgi:dTDP-4-amino-4,6-dideoxygalactose transaminase
MNPHQVTRDFEQAICEYTGATYAVAVNSCTMALLLACAFRRFHSGSETVEIPKLTYVSVPQSIIHAGHRVSFRDEDWLGSYELKPLNVWDSARWFSAGMYGEHQVFSGTPNPMVCVSFHASKTLGIEQGGAILHSDPIADQWLRRARFDGRAEGIAPKDDVFDMLGWHCYLNPSTAAQGLLKIHSLPKYNEELKNDDYPDLSQLEIFKHG